MKVKYHNIKPLVLASLVGNARAQNGTNLVGGIVNDVMLAKTRKKILKLRSEFMDHEKDLMSLVQELKDTYYQKDENGKFLTVKDENGAENLVLKDDLEQKDFITAYEDLLNQEITIHAELLTSMEFDELKVTTDDVFALIDDEEINPFLETVSTED